MLLLVPTFFVSKYVGTQTPHFMFTNEHCAEDTLTSSHDH